MVAGRAENQTHHQLLAERFFSFMISFCLVNQERAVLKLKSKSLGVENLTGKSCEGKKNLQTNQFFKDYFY